MVSFEELTRKGWWSDAEDRLEKLKSFHAVKKGYDLVREDSTAPLGFLRKVIRKMLAIDPESGYRDWSSGEIYGETYVLNSLTPRDSKQCYQAALEVVGEHCFEGRPESVKGRYKRFLVEKVDEIWQEFLLPYPNSLRNTTVKESATTQLRNVTNLTYLGRHKQLRGAWRKTELLVGEYNRRIQKHYDPSKMEENLLVVHALTSMRCPPVVIWFALRMFPEQIKTRDQFGNLPLHIVTSICDVSNRFHGLFPSYLASAGGSAFEVIFRRFPEGSKFANNEGSLPLSLVLRAERSRDRVDPLVEAAPEALTSRDPKMRLWPFLLAAQGNVYAVSCSYTLTYDLLRSNPSVLSLRNRSEPENLEDRLHALLRNRNMQLEAQLQELEAENKRLKQENMRLKGQPNESGKRKGGEGSQEASADKKLRME